LRTVKADYQGHVAELLSKATRSQALETEVTAEDREILLDSLRMWGALDENYRFVKGSDSSERRGYDRDPGGGLSARPEFSEPVALEDLLRSGLWAALQFGDAYDFQTTIFQPVGGMGQVGHAFGSELAPLIRYNAKIVEIHQDDKGVAATFEDLAAGSSRQTLHADWCVCTIPLSILGQIPMNVDGPMAQAIAAVPYCTGLKVGLQFKRRFWEEDEQIYGGITYTDLPIGQISYPSSRYFDSGKGVLLGAYIWDMVNSMDFASMSPAERVAKAGWNMAAKSMRNTHRNLTTASQLPGIERRSPWAVSVFGRTPRAPNTMTIYAPSTAELCSRESTPPICRPGRKAP
jgi:monoamine oxidase